MNNKHIAEGILEIAIHLIEDGYEVQNNLFLESYKEALKNIRSDNLSVADRFLLSELFYVE